jgi:hypothetical protein
VEWLPQVGRPAVVADHHQSVERLFQQRISAVVRLGPGLDRAHEQTMGGRHVAVGVQLEGGCGDRRLERALEVHVAPTELGQHLRGVAEVTGHIGADVGGRCQSPEPLGVPRAELRRASQRLDAADGVASGEDPPRRTFELGRY